MARRRDATVADTPMPEEFLRRPQTEAEIARWLPAGAEPPGYWGDSVESWRVLAAHREWSAARIEWRTQHDPTFWLYRAASARRKEY